MYIYMFVFLYLSFHIHVSKPLSGKQETKAKQSLYHTYAQYRYVQLCGTWILKIWIMAFHNDPDVSITKTYFLKTSKFRYIKLEFIIAHCHFKLNAEGMAIRKLYLADHLLNHLP